jgi:hypothetical protein
MNDSESDQLKEIVERVRRIETRTTIIGQHLGADVGGGTPRWTLNRDGSGRITVPTANCSLGQLMKVIPHNWEHGAHVYVNSDFLFALTIPPR